MGHLQPSRVTSRVTSSQKWRTSSPPATFVRNRVLYVKFLPKFSARAARSLAMQIRKSHPESHPCKIQRTQVTSITSESHPRVTSGQNSEASHIRVVTSTITSGQNPVTSRGPPYCYSCSLRTDLTKIKIGESAPPPRLLSVLQLYSVQLYSY